MQKEQGRSRQDSIAHAVTSLNRPRPAVDAPVVVDARALAAGSGCVAHVGGDAVRGGLSRAEPVREWVACSNIPGSVTLDRVARRRAISRHCTRIEAREGSGTGWSTSSWACSTLSSTARAAQTHRQTSGRTACVIIATVIPIVLSAHGTDAGLRVAEVEHSAAAVWQGAAQAESAGGGHRRRAAGISGTPRAP